MPIDLVGLYLIFNDMESLLFFLLVPSVCFVSCVTYFNVSVFACHTLSVVGQYFSFSFQYIVHLINVE